MAKTNCSIYNYTLLIVLLLTVLTFSSQGRLIGEKARVGEHDEVDREGFKIARSGEVRKRALKVTTNDERPTTPGGSPGVGHSTLTNRASIQDERPTTPGGSPGVGHSTLTNKVTAKDERPTTPGGSPGVGHPTITNKALTKDERPATPTPGTNPDVGHSTQKNV